MKYKSITASPPGWWAVYQDGDEELWSSVAAWVIGIDESFGDEDGQIVGIDPSVEVWIGDHCDHCEQSSNFIRYQFDPDRKA
tara:strand:- start:697 stop:942 length:246 start_codon:yes stop_codon:yes gene_type:complete